MIGTLTPVLGMTGRLSGGGSVTGELTRDTRISYYEGQTTFTPSGEQQTIEVNGYTMGENIIINPVPSGWGQITWNGAWLTVS